VESYRTPVVTVAAVLAVAGIAATMLLVGTGGLAAALTIALTAVQVSLLLAVRLGALRTRQFLLAWSGQAGLTYLVAGDPVVESALVYLVVGLVFAAVVMTGLALWRPDRDPEPEERDGGTRPLPVVDGD